LIDLGYVVNRILESFFRTSKYVGIHRKNFDRINPSYAKASEGRQDEQDYSGIFVATD
jgi:hypothetical protein